MADINGALGAIEIQERHGVANVDGSFVDVRDADKLVRVCVNEGGAAGFTKSVTVSPEKARYLARKLYRLARRAEHRGKEE